MQLFDPGLVEFRGIIRARWVLLLVYFALLLTHTLLPATQGLHFSVANIEADTFALVTM